MKLVEPSLVESAKCERINLKNIAPFEKFFDNIKDMLKICIENEGVGIAAPQVGIPLMFFVALNTETKDFGLFMNPEYEALSTEQCSVEESCLTYGVENKYKVNRFHKIIAKWEEANIREQMLIERQKMLIGIDAQIFQHETDHCFGKTIAMIGEKVI